MKQENINKYIGIPFKEMNCYDLVSYIYKEELGLILPTQRELQIRIETLDEVDVSIREETQRLRGQFKEIDELRENCIVQIDTKCLGVGNHLCFYTGYQDKVIDTDLVIGKSHLKSYNIYSKDMIVGYFVYEKHSSK